MEKYQLRLPTCFYCDMPLDHQFDSIITPDTQRLFVNYQPCDRCAKNFKGGFLLIGVVEKPQFKGQPPITKHNDIDFYPTQNIMLISHKVKDEWCKLDPNLAHIKDDSTGAYLPDDYVKEAIAILTQNDTNNTEVAQ